MLIISILETLPTHIITSPLACLFLFHIFYFELLTLSNRTGILYPGATRSTSKVHINIMYIQYTFGDFASLLIYQVSRVVLLQWPFPSLQEHLVSGFGLTLGFFARAANDLLFHEVSLFPLPFLKLVVLLTINNWCSFLISTFAVSTIASCSRIIIYPWYL